MLVLAALLGAGTAAAQSAADVDWDAVKAAWSSLTPSERAGYEALMPPRAGGRNRLAADTCMAATHDISTLPYMTSSTTTGLADDVSLAAAGACAGGGAQFGGTGTGPDIAYRVTPDINCSVNVNMDPTDTTGPDDLALYVVTDCSSVAASCLGVDDAGGNGTPEDVAFAATAGVDHFIIVDGFLGAAGPFALTITETTTTGCQLVPVELQNFTIE